MPAEIREIIGEIRHKQVIASGSSVKIRKKLSKMYGRGSWRKMKGIAGVCLTDGSVRLCEIHWFEAHGIGRINVKVKHYL